MERPRRAHGLQPPYNSMQVSTWVFLPTLVLEFLFFVSPILPLEASIPCTILFCGLAAASAYLGIRAMGTDPADPRLDAAVNSPDADGTRTPCDARTWDPNEPTKQCWICDIQVGEKSMHCKFCNKCVDHFDHHCMCKCVVLCSAVTVSKKNVRIAVSLTTCLRLRLRLRLLRIYRAQYMCWQGELYLLLSNHGIHRCHAHSPCYHSTGIGD
jgi:hypothetical protein